MAEGTRLLSVRRVTPTAGSNPALSAKGSSLATSEEEWPSGRRHRF